MLELLCSGVIPSSLKVRGRLGFLPTRNGGWKIIPAPEKRPGTESNEDWIWFERRNGITATPFVYTHKPGMYYQLHRMTCNPRRNDPLVVVFCPISGTLAAWIQAETASAEIPIKNLDAEWPGGLESLYQIASLLEQRYELEMRMITKGVLHVAN